MDQWPMNWMLHIAHIRRRHSSQSRRNASKVHYLVQAGAGRGECARQTGAGGFFAPRQWGSSHRSMVSHRQLWQCLLADRAEWAPSSDSNPALRAGVRLHGGGSEVFVELGQGPPVGPWGNQAEPGPPRLGTCRLWPRIRGCSQSEASSKILPEAVGPCFLAFGKWELELFRQGFALWGCFLLILFLPP